MKMFCVHTGHVCMVRACMRACSLIRCGASPGRASTRPGHQRPCMLSSSAVALGRPVPLLCRGRQPAGARHASSPRPHFCSAGVISTLAAQHGQQSAFSRSLLSRLWFCLMSHLGGRLGADSDVYFQCRRFRIGPLSCALGGICLGAWLRARTIVPWGSGGTPSSHKSSFRFNVVGNAICVCWRISFVQCRARPTLGPRPGGECIFFHIACLAWKKI
jgi:hypothetical protein